MPGHKRQILSMEDPYRFDLTEIDGFDNLHAAEDILKYEQDRAARLYQSEETHFMINGSSGGILSAIAGVFHRGDRILVARNCHKSVYHGMELNGLKPVYIWPDMDEKTGIYQGIRRQQVEEMLDQYPDIKGVLLTSPNYEGIFSDVKGICEAAHKRGIPCIVDEAHGAHLRWCGFKDSVELGADVVIQSLHKTMPTLTQTAQIHLNGTLISKERVRRMLTVYQTSSPSYVLMASMSLCMTWIEEEGQQAFKVYEERMKKWREDLSCLKNIQLYSPSCLYDWGKCVITVCGTGMTGPELHTILRDRYELQMEMVSSEYVLAMTTVGDSEEGLERLSCALKEIDRELSEKKLEDSEKWIYRPEPPVQKMKIEEAVLGQIKRVPLMDGDNHVMGDYIYLYPPGVPLLVPGEVLQMKQIEQIQDYLEKGLDVHGGYHPEDGTIDVIDEICG